MAMHDITCPLCGTVNPPGTNFCQKASCGAWLTRLVPPQKADIAPDAPTATETQEPTQDSQSYHPESKIAQNPPSRKRVLGTPRRASRTMTGAIPKRGIGRWLIPSAVILALPAAYFGGYLHGFSTLRGAITKPTVIRQTIIKGGITGKAPANPTRGIAGAGPQPSRTPTQPPVTKTVTATVTKSPKTSQPALPSYLAQLHGTIKNGQLQTVVWAGISPNGPLYPVSLMVDTGAVTTMVSGRFFQACGDQPTGQTGVFSGIGGNTTVQYWPSVWVFPQDKPINPIIAGSTAPGGVNRSVLGPEGVIVLLGQNVISQSTLVQNGTKWTLTYPVQ